MDPSDVIQIVSIVILLFLSAFFSSAETALLGISPLRIRTLVEEGNKRAVTLEKVVHNKSKMLSAILIGNNVVNLSSSSLITTFVIRKLGNAYVGAATGILTLLILIFGEISPKTMATLKAEAMALRFAGIISVLMKILTPVIFIVNLLARGFLRLMHVDPDAKTETITENELRTIVDVSHEEGVIESEERKMINNVVDFGDAQARDIMVPRINMVFASEDATYDELLEIYRECMFTRIPVYRDTTDNVIGIINMKDLLFYRKETPFQVQNYLREAYFTYEFKKTSELFMEMRQNSVSIAIVLDEYGATAGLVTLEDLLEEIVGEIRDEYDEDELQSLQKIGDLEYRVEGSMKLDDINEALELTLSSEDYDSVGGLIIGELDHLPEAGESVVTQGIRFVVEAMDKNRIEWVRMYLPEPGEDSSEEDL
ncbi:HlyC/CorC family transporter [Fusibacillus kribbianus]|uniref:Hemolysin family protein n=1 Tax=Fusibacillus kribbianus TaxID=3044208 RepID=A0AAP4F0B6_9FIRM|nr:hemolysin family protein [Ruminococcus sp. YH-rum2234]MDI9241588.1 hemolysin family protein [Ruminococcus sp. YH-rum2234]